MTAGPLRVCVYGLHTAEALHGKRLKGGAELQAVLVALGLAEGGCDVTLVDPEGEETLPPAPNFRVVTIPGWNEGPHGLRLFTRRLPRLLRTLMETRAEIYYCRGFTFLYLVPYIAARRTGARFVLAAASDTDLLGFRARYRKSYKGKSSAWVWLSTILPNEFVHWYLLRKADAILIQHDGQALDAGKRPRKVVRLNNLLDHRVASVRTIPRGRNVVVVGTLSLAKGITGLVPVVAQLPGVTFEFIGEAVDGEGQRAQEALSRMENVILRGPLDRAGTLERIAAAKALLNVSPREGFPNTFLEAWALETPVIALHVDPGGLLTTEQMGYCCHGDVAVMRDLLVRERYPLDTARTKAAVLERFSGRHVVEVFHALTST